MKNHRGVEMSQPSKNAYVQAVYILSGNLRDAYRAAGVYGRARAIIWSRLHGTNCTAWFKREEWERVAATEKARAFLAAP